MNGLTLMIMNGNFTTFVSFPTVQQQWNILAHVKMTISGSFSAPQLSVVGLTGTLHIPCQLNYGLKTTSNNQGEKCDCVCMHFEKLYQNRSLPAEPASTT